MTSDGISNILGSYLTELEGKVGFWRGLRDEVQLFVLSDDDHDRIRIMAPIGEVKDLEPDLLHVLLQANYDRALDARYAMRGKEVWSVSVHPLATLAPDDFGDFLDQVVRLVKNTGSTYASSDLVFGGGEDLGDQTNGESTLEGEDDDEDDERDDEGEGDSDGDDEGTPDAPGRA
jgi:hypothetical protein